MVLKNMDNKLFEYVKNLTSDDKKTLSEKVNKLFEEGGELARVILPYSSAPGTKHRFVTRSHIIEEIADIILVALSIGIDVGMDLTELEILLNKKARYWQEIQSNETFNKNIEENKIPFEIHITVKAETDIEKFKSVCLSIGVKPILLDLQLNNNEIMKDLMTSSIHIGGNKSVIAEMERIENGLEIAGYNVIRSKIETVPWHPMAPNYRFNLAKEMPRGCYFESHIPIRIQQNQINEIRSVINELNCRKDIGLSIKLSSNALKSFDEDQTKKYMITVRSKNFIVYQDFLEKIKVIKRGLEYNLHYLNLTHNSDDLVEFAIYDSNIEHDYRWISSD